jgi:hypothetical protein
LNINDQPLENGSLPYVLCDLCGKKITTTEITENTEKGLVISLERLPSLSSFKARECSDVQRAFKGKKSRKRPKKGSPWLLE